MAAKVLWVIKGLGPGGAETLLAAAAQAHDHDRFHIECAYVLPYKDHLVARLEAARVRTHCVSNRDTDVLWPLRLARLIRQGGWDVVHTHSPVPASVARLAVLSMRTRRPKLVTTEHNTWGSFSWPTRVANRITFRGNDAVFTVSDETRASLNEPWRRDAVALRHGIDVAQTAGFGQQREKVRTELGIGDDEFVIGTVANFREQKDYPNLLEAARILIGCQPLVRFVIVGQGPLEAETRALARELRLDDRVLFTGFRPDAARVMSSFDVFTLASKWEGLPVALMEALALGLPIVATNVGGVAEDMNDGVDALLVPPRDANALAAGWRRMIGDDDLRARLGAAARCRSPEFDASRATREVERVYSTLAPQNPTDQRAVATPRRVKPPTGLDIRPASADDKMAILTLLQRALGWDDDPRFTELYRWKHELNAFGPSPTWVATDGERIVGVRIFMRWEFTRGGRVLRAVRAVDTATDPDYQGRGLFTALTLHALDEMKTDGVDFVFNTPNAQSRPGYLKMGWREVGHLPTAVRVRGVASAGKVVKARVPSDHWSQPMMSGAPFAEWADARLSLPAPDHLPIRSLATNASDNYYRWRFGLPALNYRVIDDRGGSVVVRMRRRGNALELVRVASFNLSPDDADRASIAVMRSAGADHTVRLGTSHVRTGFVPVPGGGPMLTWRALNEAGMPPLPNWSLTMGDIELF
jgi:L-malate glycosyltransferase